MNIKKIFDFSYFSFKISDLNTYENIMCTISPSTPLWSPKVIAETSHIVFSRHWRPFIPIVDILLSNMSYTNLRLNKLRFFGDFFFVLRFFSVPFCAASWLLARPSSPPIPYYKSIQKHYKTKKIFCKWKKFLLFLELIARQGQRVPDYCNWPQNCTRKTLRDHRLGRKAE